MCSGNLEVSTFWPPADPRAFSSGWCWPGGHLAPCCAGTAPVIRHRMAPRLPSATMYAPTDSHSGKPRLVWVVDDSQTDAERVRRLLDGRYQVEVFSDGTSAVEQLGNGRR